MVTASQVKDLREKTGAGMMDCKKVLTETDGDMEKAIELLRERGIAKAAKKSDRIAAEGLVDAYVSEDGKIGAVVEVNAETDFVAKNDEFKKFVADVAKQIAQTNPANVEELLNAKSIVETDKTVNEVLTNKIATIGENMSIRRFARFESNGLIEKYIHGDGKIGVLVELNGGDSEVAKDVCMQIAAAKPEYLNREAVPQERLDKEMDKLEKNLGGIKEMNEIPGVLFVVDPKKEHIAVLEAHKLGIPVVGLVDTNCNPEEVDYAIPGNDDAIRAVKLIADCISNAVIEGRQGEDASVDSEMEEIANNEEAEKSIETVVAAEEAKEEAQEVVEEEKTTRKPRAKKEETADNESEE